MADTLKVQADVVGHHGTLEQGTLKIGDVLRAEIDAHRRARTQRNHSATHLMHKALREVLGAHVQQKGSLVDAEKTRFDFAHNAPDDRRRNPSRRADRQQRNPRERAGHRARDAIRRSGEGRRDGAVRREVRRRSARVLDLGFSRELCGGTHVHRTGDIGFFKIVVEGGVAAGIAGSRRSPATTRCVTCRNSMRA
ncbi:hypothetical protein [Burkholderia ambifaria]|uniref:hypothetical protein n=1 Tax=Burkholderia ambifaria TaxID=152480 RepID=UPI00387DC67C